MVYTQGMGNQRAWMSKGNCSGLAIIDPQKYDKAFFPNRGRPVIEPEYRKYCDACPVILNCLDFALAHNLEGIWGSTTKNQRDLFPPHFIVSIVMRAKRDGWFETYLPILELHHPAITPSSYPISLSSDDFEWDFEVDSPDYLRTIDTDALSF